MNKIEVTQEDLSLLMKYLEKNAKGQNLTLEITDLSAPLPRLKINLVNNLEEEVEITIYSKEAARMPRISWEDRLASVL